MLALSRVAAHPSFVGGVGGGGGGSVFASSGSAYLAEVADAQESSNLRFWTLIDAVRVQVHAFLISLYSQLSARAPAGHDPSQLIGALLASLSDASLNQQVDRMLYSLNGDRFEKEYANGAAYIVRRVMVQESPEFCDALVQAGQQQQSSSSSSRVPQLNVSLDEPRVFLMRSLRQAMTSPEVSSGDWFVSTDMAARVDAIKNAVVRAMMSSASGEFCMQSVVVQQQQQQQQSRRATAWNDAIAPLSEIAPAAPSAALPPPVRAPAPYAPAPVPAHAHAQPPVISAVAPRSAPAAAWPSLSQLASSQAPLPTVLGAGARATSSSSSRTMLSSARAPPAPTPTSSSSRLFSVPTVGASAVHSDARARSDFVTSSRYS